MYMSNTVSILKTQRQVPHTPELHLICPSSRDVHVLYAGGRTVDLNHHREPPPTLVSMRACALTVYVLKYVYVHTYTCI